MKILSRVDKIQKRDLRRLKKVKKTQNYNKWLLILIK